MRFEGAAYRAHDPRWSFSPLSGAGAAIHGGRFNRAGQPALYLALTPMGAVKESTQGFAHKLQPLTLVEYEVDCEDIEDLTAAVDLACGWLALAKAGKTPPTWTLADRLQAQGAAGVLVPSFAPGAMADEVNLVLWKWSDRRPHRCRVFDPAGRLPKNQRSWR